MIQGIQYHVLSFCTGLRDALSIYRILDAWMSLKAIRIPVIKCFLLNGFVLIGGILAFEKIAKPFIWSFSRSFFHLSSKTTYSNRIGSTELSSWENTMKDFMSYLFHFLWVVPFYTLSYFVNQDLYTTIAKVLNKDKINKEHVADHIAEHIRTGTDPKTAREADDGRQLNKTAIHEKKSSAPPQQRSMRKLHEMVYRFVLIWVLIAQSWLCYTIFNLFSVSILSWIGFFLSCISNTYHCCLLAFDYKWSFRGAPLHSSLSRIETNWSYYLGWGTPITIVTMIPQSLFISLGLFALLFPFSLIVAIGVDEESLTVAKEPVDNSRRRLPFFKFATFLLNHILGYFRGVFSKREL